MIRTLLNILPRPLVRPLVMLFDRKKKEDMERLYATEGDHWGRTESMAQIKDALGLLGARRYCHVLDVGAGEGYVAEALASRAERVTAIDISEHAITAARVRCAHLAHVHFIPANIRTWKSEERFDLIVLADVLYYLGDALFPGIFMETIAHIGALATEDGEILVTHFIAPWRDGDMVEMYIRAFTEAGFVLMRDTTYRSEEKEWRHLLLKKESRPASV